MLRLSNSFHTGSSTASKKCEGEKKVKNKGNVGKRDNKNKHENKDKNKDEYENNNNNMNEERNIYENGNISESNYINTNNKDECYKIYDKSNTYDNYACDDYNINNYNSSYIEHFNNSLNKEQNVIYKKKTNNFNVNKAIVIKNKITYNKEKEVKNISMPLYNYKTNEMNKLSFDISNMNISPMNQKYINKNTSLKSICTNNNNNNKRNVLIDDLKTIKSEIVELRNHNNTCNDKLVKDLVMYSFSNSVHVDLKKEDMLIQYEKYKHNKKEKKRKRNNNYKMKYKIFKKSVLYSNYYGPDIIHLFNQTKLNLSFYQREIDDFLNVIRNLQNIVLIEREKYNELKEVLKYTTEEIEKENSKLYEELNTYKQKYNKLKGYISNIGYGNLFNIKYNDDKNIKYNNNKEKSYMDLGNIYDNEYNEDNYDSIDMDKEVEKEYDYVIVNKNFNLGNDYCNNKYINRSRNSKNSSLLNYLDF
ncbi:hypothetical protein PRSY57_0601500 [Plasmodium reichenowi]|uniref:Uncharacterized protein n=1 Tax=Plasmodium reichenowi TaxID=5854 RepID=A0A151LNZ7_PLARE|nr:hypothetical protein PRSY57_0601500 [Plasmodium reichenowi]KYO00904.1 hypothetical protein PRSY57_0601500 [Plasmodium reichenowi]